MLTDCSTLRPDHDIRQLHRCLRIRSEVVVGSHRPRRVHLRWHSGGSPASDCYDVRCRFLQTCRWLNHGLDYGQQECLGIRVRRIHHAVGDQIWVCASDYDEHVPDHAVVLVRFCLLLLREEVQDLEQK